MAHWQADCRDEMRNKSGRAEVAMWSWRHHDREVNRTGARAPVRRDVASGGGGRGQATLEVQDACVRCYEIQGAQGAGSVEATWPASGRNADVSGASYFSADEQSSIIFFFLAKPPPPTDQMENVPPILWFRYHTQTKKGQCPCRCTLKDIWRKRS